MPLEYDLIKDRLEGFLGDSALAHRLFFAALDRLFLRSRYIHRELQKLKASGFSPARLLDAGSGFGQYSFRLARSFPRAKVTGLDLKSERVEASNRLARQFQMDNLAFESGDLLTMEAEAAYDLVLSVDVLEHIEEDRRVIANIARSLRPSGLFILTTPFYDSSSSKDTAFVDEHVRPGYSRKETEQKLAEAGLELRQFIITYGPWGNVAWTLLQKWPMSWLSGRIGLLPLVLVYLVFAYPIAWFCMQIDMRVNNTGGGGILALAVKR